MRRGSILNLRGNALAAMLVVGLLALLLLPQAAHAEVSAASPATPAEVFSGLGFDACSAPSESTLAAWGTASPYGAVGVYIGGVNRACSQTNLTATWVSDES